ncbi:filamentous hemagglutinin N-terminal domain-containing protein [Fodinicurvata sp. EGI_FJ10296]|uniref:two-partner secretion domain-containing protein n=1 Tax=Fodinicurvata sp. EGI_FJ10296 TaxID=3231908 RepID=UPI0034521ABF
MKATFNRNDIGRHFLSRTALSGGYVPGLLAAVGLISASSGAGAISPETLPNLDQIVGGDVNISVNGQTMTIQQALSRGVIDWREFSIGGDASVIFDQLAGNDSITVNRVTGDDVSSILGDLQANGNVWLMNPNGVMFGDSARVDVGGLVASTGTIDADAFLGGAGEIEIFGATDGSVVNEGEITVADGGIAAFVAPHVRNSGTINARMGVITLAGAEQATVDLYGDGLIEIAVADQAVSATNDGTLNADGGVIRMSAAAASGVVDSVVNMDGVVRANSVEQSDGRIVLNGGENGTVNVGGDVMADGGTIDVEARDMVVSAEVGAPRGESDADTTVNLVLGNDVEAGRLEITESGFLRVADLSLDSRFRSGGQAAGIVIDNARADGLHGQRLSLNTRYELENFGFNPSDEVHVTSDHASVQNAVDAVDAGGTVFVAPGTYEEGVQANGGRWYSMYIDNSVSIIGVDGDGNPITSATDAEAVIVGQHQSSYGANFEIRADDVSIQGLILEARGSDYADYFGAGEDLTVVNKAVEVYGNNFSLLDSEIRLRDFGDGRTVVGAGAVYFNEAEARSGLIEGNILAGGISVNNGAGIAEAGEDGIRIIGNEINAHYPGTSAISVSGNQSEGVGSAWRNASSGLPTVSGNDINAVNDTPWDGSVSIFSALDDDSSLLPDTAWINDFIANNNLNRSVVIRDANGDVQLGESDDASPFTARIYSDISPALDAAEDGTTLDVGAGRYEEVLTIDKSVSIAGSGTAETEIDTTGTTSYGLTVEGDDVTLSGFTLTGQTDTNSNSNYGIKIQPLDTSDETARVRDVTLSDLRIDGFSRAGVDMNGVVGATLDRVIVDGLGERGAGIQISDSADVTITNSETMNNAWGSVGIYQANRFFDQQTTGISIDGTNTFGENIGVYTQSYSDIGLELGDLDLTFADYVARNANHRENGDDFAFYRSGLQDSIAFAAGLNQQAIDRSKAGISVIQGWTGSATDDQFYVGTTGDAATAMSINAAIQAANGGDTVNVAAGEYNQNVRIDRNIDLLSIDGADQTSIAGQTGSSLGAIQVTNNTTGVRIGAEGRGFEITGIEGTPGLEKAAVYFQGGHSGARVEGNRIVANGDAGLMSEYSATISDFEIVGNEFAGTTFSGDTPAGDGFEDQFVVESVPRQLVVMGGGSGGGNTSDILFADNEITGTAGGINADGDEQGNTLVTIDAADATITGNTFAGTTTRYGASLRARGPNTVISGNTFESDGLGGAASHVYTEGNSVADIFNNNTFDRSSVVVGGNYVDHSIAAGLARASAGDSVLAGAGSYEESLSINESVTLTGAGVGETIIDGGIRLRGQTADGKVLDGVGISDLTINAANGSIGLLAESETDSGYNTTDLALSNLEINANGSHGIGLFDVNGVTLNSVSLNGNGSETGIEAIGVDGFEMTGGSITDMATGVNQFGVTGYEDNGELEFSDVTFEDNDTHLRTTLDASADYLGDLVASNDFDRSVYVDGGSAIHSAIGSALGDAADGDDVIVSAGPFAETLSINDGVSILGAGQGQTIIDSRATTGYGIAVRADDVTLDGFTLLGQTATNAGGNYGVKVQPSGGATARVRDFTLSNVTIEGFSRSPIDLNGVVGATIDSVVADGQNTSGAGIQITDSADVTLRDTTTRGNNWGSVALYQTNRFFDQQLTNITIDDSNTFNEALGVFTQTYETAGQTLPLQEIGDLNLTFATHTVQNPDHRDNGDEFTFYRNGVQDAVAFAVNLNPGERASSVVRGWNGTADTNQYFVGTAGLAGGGSGAMSINTAISGSQNGSTINVRNGTYNEAVSVNANRSMVFNNATVNSLTSSAPMGIRGAVTAAAGNITLGGPTSLTGATTLRTPNGDINLNGVVTGEGRNLTLTGSSDTTTARLNANIGGVNSRIGNLTINNVNRITQAADTTAYVTASDLDAAEDISLSFNTINALGSVNARSGGNLSGGLTSTSGNVSAGSGGNTNVDVATNGGSATVSGQDVSGNISTGGGNVILSAGQSVNANANAGSGSIQATGGQSVSGSYSGGSATFNAPDVNGSVNVGGNVTITSASAALTGNAGSLTPTGPGVVSFNGNTFVSGGAGQSDVGVEGFQPQGIGSVLVVVAGDGQASQLLALPEDQLFGMISTAAGPGAMDGVSRIIVARTSDNIASLLQGGNIVVLDLTGDGVDRIMAGADDEEEEAEQVL